MKPRARRPVLIWFCPTCGGGLEKRLFTFTPVHAVRQLLFCAPRHNVIPVQQLGGPSLRRTITTSRGNQLVYRFPKDPYGLDY